MNNLEQIIQITAIVTFIASAIVFFVKIGEYKSLVNNEIEILKDDVKECKEDIKNLESEINSIKNNNNQITSLLVEVKTKLELLIATSGMFKNNNEKFKS